MLCMAIVKRGAAVLEEPRHILQVSLFLLNLMLKIFIKIMSSKNVLIILIHLLCVYVYVCGYMPAMMQLAVYFVGSLHRCVRVSQDDPF